MRIFALTILLLAVAGCGHVKPTAVQATGDALAQTRSHIGSAAYHVDQIKADGSNKVHAESAKVELVAADKSAETGQDSNRREAKERADFENSWSYKIAVVILRIWWMILLGIALAIALRSAALLMTGPAGAAVSVASHVLLGVSTAGASVMHSILENVWTRKVKPTPVVVVEPQVMSDPLPPIDVPAQGVL